jgi:hypothetical protein
LRSEKYWRVPCAHGKVEVILGLEIVDQDHQRWGAQLALQTMQAVMSKVDPTESYLDMANDLERLTREIWPERSYFIEVGCDDDFWVQIYYPSKLWERG